EADLGDRQVRGPQERLRPLDPTPGQGVARRLAVGGAERPGEVEPGGAGVASHRVEVERLRVVAIDQVAGATEGGQEELRGAGHPPTVRGSQETRPADRRRPRGSVIAWDQLPGLPAQLGRPCPWPWPWPLVGLPVAVASAVACPHDAGVTVVQSIVASVASRWATHE